MRAKSIFILTGVAVLALGLAVFVALSQPRVISSDQAGEVMFPSLAGAVEGLKTVVIRHKGGSISLDWDGKAWRYREKANYPADREKVTNLVVSVARLTKLEPKTSQPDRYARLDLQEP